MKATVKGKTYDTDRAEEIAQVPIGTFAEHTLFKTSRGEFFLYVLVTCLDGRQLGLNEEIPEELNGFDQRGIEARKARFSEHETITPMSSREAMIWCVQTQIPETFRGYLLDCI